MATRQVITPETWEETFEKQAINPDLLHEELAEQLDSGFAGVSAGSSGVRVIFNRPFRKGETTVIAQVLAKHDAEKLSTRQAAEVERKGLLAMHREVNTLPVDVRDFVGEPDAVQALAAKIAWLEQEILELRRG